MKRSKISQHLKMHSRRTGRTAQLLLVVALAVSSLVLVPATASAVPTKGAQKVSLTTRGITGTETFALHVGETEVLAGTASTEWSTFSTTLSVMATGKVVVAFTNDGVIDGKDRGLEVESLTIGDVVLPANDPAVYSEGAFTPLSGCSPGFVQSTLLACGGMFVFGSLNEAGALDAAIDPHGNQRFLPVGGPADIDVVARGHFGGELFEVKVGETVVGTASATRFWRTYRFTRPDDLEGEISVIFTSDFASDVADANLDVDYVETNGQLFEAEEALSTGTYVAGEGCVTGLHLSSTLHCNGGFFFGDVVPRSTRADSRR